ncbi:Ferritin-like domain-containing protein [Candidatus Bealeia paramacronuclearis]|uniref:Ferritin-like domain-containing protein n=1 Tax=Candidatus Bealeia paramacronuclearis TaxID=1921001 RepID=A0ABZ2C2S2_9PROT|nr:Ferritin-like domain-containing protein [Candidatus Bealeia paramacronuclearis]
MIKIVGLQGDFITALKYLVELDYDAVAAYESAINRLESAPYKATLERFKIDHEGHIQGISEFLRKNDEDAPTGPSVKSIMTQGKVVISNLFGDKAILRAMRSNEIDTNTAYGRINNYERIPDEIKQVLEQGLKDEKKHLAWIEKSLEA